MCVCVCVHIYVNNCPASSYVLHTTQTEIKEVKDDARDSNQKKSTVLRRGVFRMFGSTMGAFHLGHREETMVGV